MMKNEREFKLRVYPTLGLSIFLPFIFIFNSLKSDIDYLSTSLLYLIIYLSLLIIPNIMILLKYSNNYKGAWIYKVAPIKELRPVFTGTIKALIFLMFLPIYLLFCIIFLFIFGLRILPDLIVVFLVACIFAVICFIIFKKSFPFSQSFDSYTQYTGCVIFVGLIFPYWNFCRSTLDCPSISLLNICLFTFGCILFNYSLASCFQYYLGENHPLN